MSNEDLFTTAAAAEYVGVSTQALGARRLAKNYERKVVRGKLFYERLWLDEWKKERQDNALKVLNG
jgi:hypothetical protein